MYGFVAFSGGSIGLVAGGVLTEALSWHWIFLVNVPIGAASPRCSPSGSCPRHRGCGLRRGADLPGAVLITAALMLGVYTVVSRPPSVAGRRALRSLCGGAAVAAARRLRRPPGHRRQPARAAAGLPLPR